MINRDTIKKSDIPRIMIAAERSGCGKTTFTCGLLQVLKNRGRNPISFKCGPDYIDPMFHEKVLGVPSTNLDPFFLDDKGIKKLILDRSTDGDCAVIEGVMGIYDGISPDSDRYSSYELSRYSDTSIILMVNARGAGRTLISVIKGLLSDDKQHMIKGVVLNQISEGYYQRLKPVLEEELQAAGYDIKLLGFLPKNDEIRISSRYLGLSLPEEIEGLQKQISLMADMIESYIDVPALLGLMEGSGPITDEDILSADKYIETAASEHISLAVARDEAFCFYYKENIEAFIKRGVDIKYFSPLRDEKLPDGISGVLLGGGYPELYAGELSSNKSMIVSIKNALSDGLPCIAECGGFLYLHKSIRTKEGEVYQMVGFIDADAEYTGHLVRFGYFSIEECEVERFSGLAGMKGHEFHYFESTKNGETALLKKASTGKEYKAMLIDDRSVMGFPHLYYNSSPEFIDEFINVMKGVTG